jgi:hypothetical protein
MLPSHLAEDEMIALAPLYELASTMQGKPSTSSPRDASTALEFSSFIGIVERCSNRRQEL